MAPPAAIRPMAKYEARKATFQPVETTNAGPSRKKAANSSKLSWPHPVPKRDKNANKDNSSDDGSVSTSLGSKEFPSPRSMANLGIHFDPTPEEPDRCSLYPEGISISHWRAGQTALDRLREEDDHICWVSLELSRRISRTCQTNQEGKLSWASESQHLFPTSKSLIEARLKTYGGSWPLDGKKGWKPTSKKLSSAGFYYSPNEDEEDCVTCMYCQCSLGGWEKGDDPVEEHQKRRPDCPIFISVLEKEEKRAEAKSTKKANTSVARGRAATRKRAAEDDEEEPVLDTKAQEKAKGQTSRQNQAVNTPAEVEEVLEEVVEEVSKPATGKKRAPAKAKKGSTRKKAAPAVKDKVDEESQPVRKSKKAKMTSDAESAEVDSALKPDQINRRNADEEIPEDAVIEASDFEDEPTRSHDHVLSDKGPTFTELVEKVKRRDSEMFKTPKQTMSSRTTVAERTPKASSPVSQLQPIAISTAVPLGDIAPLTQLDTITNEEKAMTVEDWLKGHVTKACTDMEIEGQKRIAKLRSKMDQGRKQAECILRGIDVNIAT